MVVNVWLSICGCCADAKSFGRIETVNVDATERVHSNTALHIAAAGEHVLVKHTASSTWKTPKPNLFVT